MILLDLKDWEEMEVSGYKLQVSGAFPCKL